MEKYIKQYALAQGLVKDNDVSRLVIFFFNKALGLRHYPLYEPF